MVPEFSENELIDRYKQQNYVYSTAPIMAKRQVTDHNIQHRMKAFDVEKFAERALTAENLKRRLQLAQPKPVKKEFVAAGKLKRHVKVDSNLPQ